MLWRYSCWWYWRESTWNANCSFRFGAQIFWWKYLFRTLFPLEWWCFIIYFFFFDEYTSGKKEGFPEDQDQARHGNTDHILWNGTLFFLYYRLPLAYFLGLYLHTLLNILYTHGWIWKICEFRWKQMIYSRVPQPKIRRDGRRHWTAGLQSS